MITQTTKTKAYLEADTDLMLRQYVVQLADECIAANDYNCTKARLATFLSWHIYDKTPVELRPFIPPQLVTTEAETK